MAGPRRGDAEVERWRVAIVLVLTLVGLAGAPAAQARAPGVAPIDPPYTPPDPFHPVPERDPDPPPPPGERLPLGWAPPSDVVVRYAPPAPGAVLRPFTPPSSAFGVGHRGVDLALEPGGAVTAAATGYVHHAGPVGALTWVTVGHADGVLTSYGPLRDLQVRRGDQVARGQPLAVLAAGGHGDGDRDGGLHWGARRGVVYLDPMTLLDPGTPRPSLVGAGAWRGTDHMVTSYAPWEGSRLGGTRLAPSPVADAPGYAVPPSPNHLVVVGGLGSRSSHVPIDPSHLGYRDRSVTLFSYAGRVDRDDLDPDDPRRDQLPYGYEDTWEGIDVAAQRLHEQLRAQRQREPGRAVDLIGHSQGGLVIIHYLTHLHDPYDPGLPSIGRVVTIGSPHGGSPLATAGLLARAQPVVGGAIELVRGMIPVGGGRTARDQIDLEAPAIDQLAAGSGFIRRYRQVWDEALTAGPAGPLAMGTEVLTIAGGTDVVVPNEATRLPDRNDYVARADPEGYDGFLASEVTRTTTLPGGHTGVLHTEAVRETAWRFLAGQELTTAGRPVSAVFTDEVGTAATVGVAYSFLFGGFTGVARRAMSGHYEVTDDLDDALHSSR